MLPSPATIRWSSSITLIDAIRPASASSRYAAVKSGPSGSGPIAANGGQAASASVATRSTEPKRRGSLSASRRPLIGLEDQMIVRQQLGRIDAPAARHAEMEDHRVAAIGLDQPVFGAPAKPRHRRAGQPLAEILAGTAGADRRGASDPRQPRGPPAPAASPRTVVSTSGSSGILRPFALSTSKGRRTAMASTSLSTNGR